MTEIERFSYALQHEFFHELSSYNREELAFIIEKLLKQSNCVLMPTAKEIAVQKMRG